MIPKLIHQIWIQGVAHFQVTKPQEYEYSIQLQQIFHSWTYKLWCDQDIVNLIERSYPSLLSMYIETQKPAFQADIARYVILHSFGGLYLDTDYAVLKYFGHLVYNCDISFACLRYDSFSSFDARTLSQWRHNNCMIASTIGHPIIKETLSTILSTQVRRRRRGGTTRSWLSAIPFTLLAYNDAVANHLQDDGVLCISNQLLEPLHAFNRHLVCVNINEYRINFPSAYAVHLGAASWIVMQKQIYLPILRFYGSIREQWQIVCVIFLIIIIISVFARSKLRRQFAKCSKALEMSTVR